MRTFKDSATFSKLYTDAFEKLDVALSNTPTECSSLKPQVNKFFTTLMASSAKLPVTVELG